MNDASAGAQHEKSATGRCAFFIAIAQISGMLTSLAFLEPLVFQGLQASQELQACLGS